METSKSLLASGRSNSWPFTSACMWPPRASSGCAGSFCALASEPLRSAKLPTIRMTSLLASMRSSCCELAAPRLRLIERGEDAGFEDGSLGSVRLFGEDALDRRPHGGAVREPKPHGFGHARRRVAGAGLETDFNAIGAPVGGDGAVDGAR